MVNNEAVSLYRRLKKAGCEIASWQSDLYVRATPEAVDIVKRYSEETGIKLGYNGFISKSDGLRWIEAPFAFEPFWAARTIKAASDTEAEWEVVGHIGGVTVWQMDDVFANSASDDEPPRRLHSRPTNCGYPSVGQLALVGGLDEDDFIPLPSREASPAPTP